MTPEFPASPANEFRRRVEALLSRQTPHRIYAPIRAEWSQPCDLGVVPMLLSDGRVVPTHWEQILKLHQLREEKIAKEFTDTFNHGVWPDAWQEILWEICALRVRNPGVPIEFLLSGANGSAKTFFAAATMMWAMVRAPSDGQNRLFWYYAMDEPNSETVQQSALYYWLPQSYKTDSGAVKTMAKTKLRYNTSGGFTDNRFGLDNGARAECRFWSKDIGSLEGPRPWCVWSDEEIPLAWLEGIRRRLLTYAEGTAQHVAAFKQLLARRAAEPHLKFPRDILWQLFQGLHLITFTPKSGYTETVASFIEGGKVMREIDATLLAKTDKRTGEAIGFEKVPKCIHCADPSRAMFYIHAWDNPWGGNWEGMKKMALKKSRNEILWWCYGVAVKIGDSPFPNFNVQAHVRPLAWLPKHGTWYHVVDPVASGGRAWFQIWAMVCGETSGHLNPGDIFVAFEWPNPSWLVKDEGYLGDWASPGGSKGNGTRGPAQRNLGWGYRRQKEEIERVEQHLHALQHPMDKTSHGTARIPIPEGNRIMDSRAANTEKENESQSMTLIEWMEQDTSPDLRDGLYFVPAGRDSGASQGQTSVHPGEQMINDLLFYDKDLAVLDEKTGWIAVPPALGKGPRLYIAETCVNLIAALRHYPGIATGRDSAFKDPIDCLRYLVIAAPIHIDSRHLSTSVRSLIGSGSGSRERLTGIGDWTA